MSDRNKQTTRVTEGNTYTTNEGCVLKVIEFLKLSQAGNRRFLVEFQDKHASRKECDEIAIIQGNVKNPYHPSVYDIGYQGVGEWKSTENGKDTKPYKAWRNMLQRCYRPRAKEDTTYKDITVCEEWHCYQDFAQWYSENHVPNWEMDKDIIAPDAKQYSPDTVIFVPSELNKKFRSLHVKDDGLYQGVTKDRNGKFSFRQTLLNSGSRTIQFYRAEDANFMYRQIRILNIIKAIHETPELTEDAKLYLSERLMEQYTLLFYQFTPFQEA